ncbi:hypothetical protein BZL30_0643 [Mycobacterium kansasii]|uniref:Uncharacterized protein n=1 Tax=Mycobacterium kansasii TaxID=1768 RepID=A0A1V3XRC8_MYCKA|nr:hypothetical protein BZL30_0643 [Mycobacterium kansasii]
MASRDALLGLLGGPVAASTGARHAPVGPEAAPALASSLVT